MYETRINNVFVVLVSRFCGSNTYLFLALDKVASCKLTKFISKVSITVHIYDTNTRCQCLQEMNKMSMTLAFMIRALRLLRTFKLVILSYVRLKEQCSHLYISDTEFKPANENIWVNIWHVWENIEIHRLEPRQTLRTWIQARDWI